MKTHFSKQYFATYVAFSNSVKVKICYYFYKKLDLQNSLNHRNNIQIIYN